MIFLGLINLQIQKMNIKNDMVTYASVLQNSLIVVMILVQNCRKGPVSIECEENLGF